MEHNAWIGRNIAEFLADETDQGWDGLYPLIATDGEIIGITDTQSDDEDAVIVDWADGIVVCGGASDAAIRMCDLPPAQAAQARELLGIED